MGVERRRARRQKGVPESQLSVARGVGVPVGDRFEGAGQPRPLCDEGGQSYVGHRGLWLSSTTQW